MSESTGSAGREGDDAARFVTFKYVRPEIEGGKKVIVLARTDHLIGGIQVIAKGGENNLHAHRHLDGFWFVLSGRARFYAEGDRVVAELGKFEGVVIPRGVKYWFESASDEPLELLQAEASDVPLRSKEELYADRIDYAPLKHPLLSLDD